jgi:hypothetical protein
MRPSALANKRIKRRSPLSRQAGRWVASGQARPSQARGARKRPPPGRLGRAIAATPKCCGRRTRSDSRRAGSLAIAGQGRAAARRPGRPCRGSRRDCGLSRLSTSFLAFPFRERSGVAPLWSIRLPGLRAHAGHLVVSAAVEVATRRFLANAAPLFEKEGHALPHALALNGLNPSRLHRPCARPGLSANDHPMDAVKIEIVERPD